jgi:NMD protein affecting ribosome stability and mRNA decay
VKTVKGKPVQRSSRKAARGKAVGKVSRTSVKGKSVSEVFRKDMRTKLENPYQSLEKYPNNTVCGDCGAVFLKGNWRWSAPDKRHDVSMKRCPACRRIRDDYAGGVLTLSGSFVPAHREEILNRVRNVEGRAKREHPLQRIMDIVEKDGEVEIRATSEHLVARLGKALKRDFDGELDLSFGKEEKFARAHWRRDV